ncbi:hypothetical protein JUNP479_4303 (plasmid) [Aeromonas jandaei]|nr:type II toxin-antitoxin system PemK/MazF family toxin [Aeromonas jandaei]BCS51492.1 hypothetical protein JUNP479_4303 [Aeromonas jandaei]
MVNFFSPLPSIGDILWCHFPQAPQLGTPGPKPRPAIVVAVSSSTNEVAVIYGTSQKTNKIYATEFVMDPSDPGFAISGLSFRTKFDCAARVKLPFNEDWFAIAPKWPSLSPLPKLGTLHPSYMPAITSAASNVTP